MAVKVTSGTDVDVSTDLVGGENVQRMKPGYGADGTFTRPAVGAGVVGPDVPRQTLASDDPAVAGIGATTDSASAISGAGSVNAKLRLITTQLAAILAGPLPVNDNGGSITVDGSITVSNFPAGFTATQSGTWTVGISGGQTVGLAAGSAVIGKVGIDQTTPGTTNSVVSLDTTTTIYNGTTALTVKYKKISCAASGQNILVAQVTSKKIRVLSLSLNAAAGSTANSFYLQSDTDSTGSPTAIYADSTNKVALDVAGTTGPAGFVLGFNKYGWFETVAGEGLKINLTNAQGVSGSLSYVEV